MPPIVHALVSVLRSLCPNVVCITLSLWSYPLMRKVTYISPDFVRDCWRSGLYFAAEFDLFPYQGNDFIQEVTLLDGEQWSITRLSL